MVHTISRWLAANPGRPRPTGRKCMMCQSEVNRWLYRLVVDIEEQRGRNYSFVILICKGIAVDIDCLDMPPGFDEVVAVHPMLAVHEMPQVRGNRRAASLSDCARFRIDQDIARRDAQDRCGESPTGANFARHGLEMRAVGEP